MNPEREPFGFAVVPPWVRNFACESCGAAPGPTVFLPNGTGGGRRVCRTCLATFDALRTKSVMTT